MNLDTIPNSLGHMIIDEERNIVQSSGDLEGNEKIAEIALKIAYTAAKVPVNPDTKDSWKRISMVIENQYVFMMTIHQHKIYLVKRRHTSDENTI